MSDFRLFRQHVCALSLKEARQIIRDRSSIILGIVLPIILIFLFGSGITFDIQDVRLGVVNTSMSSLSTQTVSAFDANKTFKTSLYKTRQEGEAALRRFDIEALLIFEKQGTSDQSQLIVDGVDAPRASMITQAVTGTMQAVQQAHGLKMSGIQVVPRVWFNESMESRWYLVPGLFVIILTMSGTMLTSLVVAREWERGTMEAMMATPISPLAFLLSKTIPYFCLGMVGWMLCLLAALFWYEIPLRGSLLLMFVASSVYLVMSLGIGLVISGLTRSQFLSSQIAVMVSFMPAMILSGFIFDLRSIPAGANVVAHLFPGMYYLEILKTSFLTGGMHTLMMKDLVILLIFMVVFLMIAYCQCQKRIRA